RSPSVRRRPCGYDRRAAPCTPASCSPAERGSGTRGRPPCRSCPRGSPCATSTSSTSADGPRSSVPAGVDLPGVHAEQQGDLLDDDVVDDDRVVEAPGRGEDRTAIDDDPGRDTPFGRPQPRQGNALLPGRGIGRGTSSTANSTSDHRLPSTPR